MQPYDLVIIGAGPAGLTAALYSARSKLKTLLIEKLMTGGQLSTYEELENYPGVQHTTGPDVAMQMEEQAQKFGAEKIFAEVTAIELDGSFRIVKTTEGDFIAKAVIVASGAKPRLLDCPGELELRGRGVSYCATCDGPLFEGADVLVVGGGNSAVEEAYYLTKFAQSVTIIHRRDRLRATKIAQDRAFANPKLQFMWNSVVEKINGTDIVKTVDIRNINTGEITALQANGVFIYVGTEANTSFVRGLLHLDENGYIVTDENMCTNIPGIYAAGDIRAKLLRQVVTAVADGAIAAYHAEKYTEEIFDGN